MSRSPPVPNLVTPALRASEPEGIRLKTETCPEGTILTPRGRHLHGTCITPGCIYSESFVSLRCSVRRFGPSCLVLLRVPQRHVLPRATWRHETNAIFRRFCASFGVCHVRRHVELLTVLEHVTRGATLTTNERKSIVVPSLRFCFAHLLFRLVIHFEIISFEIISFV